MRGAPQAPDTAAATADAAASAADTTRDTARRSERIAELEQQLARVMAGARLARLADEVLEEALRGRQSLDRAIAMLFPLLADHVGACAALVRTCDEDLQLRDFRWQRSDDDQPIDDEVAARVWRAAQAGAPLSEPRLVSRPLDVAGERFGAAAVQLAAPLAADELRHASDLFGSWCEQLDNHLAAVATARRKHQTTRAISAALASPVLDEGVVRAVAALAAEVEFDTLVLVHHDEDELGPNSGATLSYKVFDRGELVHDSSTADDQQLRAVARQLLAGDVQAVADRFGLEHFREQVLISGLKHQRLVGRVVISRAGGGFNTFDRDLLERFADHLRQRIVDFNREARGLSLCFSPATVRRLLAHEDYVERFLRPQERSAAVLYCDIVGFTRISEQVLQRPALIARLVDTWSAQVVRIIWDSDGVFDKMVGDCIIGLWGPPLFDIDGREACRRAAAAARRIRDFTRSLGDTADLPGLREMDVPLGVSTGLNYCPLFVGRIGPNEDYTGFSSGMNCTARLQGMAGRDEILCMESFVEASDSPESFGPRREATVKNVGQPLVFRPLLG